MATTTVDVIVEGGKANAGPPLGPTLAPLKVNVKDIVDEINKKTQSLDGMKVPVKVIVNIETKSFEIHVGTPPTSAIIMKELKLDKGAATPGSVRVGDLTEAQVKTIAETKFGDVTDATYSMVVGTAKSMGVTVGEGAVTKEELERYEQEKKAAEEEAKAAEEEEKPEGEEEKEEEKE